MIKQIFLISSIVILYANSQDLSQQYYSSFDLYSIDIDTTLSEKIRDEFDDDDGSQPLKSFSFDLNNDGINEKFIPNEFLCGTGGCPWVIYNPKTKKTIGEIGGKVIFINTAKKNGYVVIETYWRDGGGEGTVRFFEYSKGKYEMAKAIDIQDEQIDQYFEGKKVLKK